MSLTGTFDGTTFHAFGFEAPVSAAFGSTDDIHANPHSGTDLAAPEGTPVPCLHAGTVVFVSYAGDPGWAETFGNSVIVDHGDGTRCLYAHMQTVLVGQGAAPLVGQSLGLVGNTGYSFGAHLHLGYSTDANPWFNKHADGGVTRLLNPLAHLTANEEPAGAVAAPSAPDGYAVLAHMASYEADILGRLARMAEARLPKFVMTAERDALVTATESIVAAVDALGG